MILSPCNCSEKMSPHGKGNIEPEGTEKAYGTEPGGGGEAGGMGGGHCPGVVGAAGEEGHGRVPGWRARRRWSTATGAGSPGMPWMTGYGRALPNLPVPLMLASIPSTSPRYSRKGRELSSAGRRCAAFYVKGDWRPPERGGRRSIAAAGCVVSRKGRCCRSMAALTTGWRAEDRDSRWWGPLTMPPGRCHLRCSADRKTPKGISYCWKALWPGKEFPSLFTTIAIASSTTLWTRKNHWRNSWRVRESPPSLAV